MPFYPVPVAESDSYDVPPAYQYEPEQPARHYRPTHHKKWPQGTPHDLPARSITANSSPIPHSLLGLQNQSSIFQNQPILN